MKDAIIAAGTSLPSRRLLLWAAWILFLTSILLPAPTGSFAGGANGISGFLVLGKVIAWSRAQPGSAAALDFWRVVILTLAIFSNIAFLFTPILRNHRTVSLACKGFLIAATVVGGSVAFVLPEFARLPAYWLWLSSIVVLTLAYVAFDGNGVTGKTPPKHTTASATSDTNEPDTGDVPELVWVWLGSALFWLTVTGFNQSHPAATASGDARTGFPAATALTSYITDESNLLPADVAARFNGALANFERESSNQIAVAIYPSSPQGAIPTFTIETADRSRLGRKGLDNGAILFIFMAERSARLEVGYGLEGVLTDVDAHRILDTQLAPAFAKGDYVEGLDATLGSIFAIVQDAYQRQQMPSKVTVFWRQLKVEVPRLAQQAWPTLSGFDLGARIGISFFGGLLGLGLWDGLRQFGRLIRNLVQGAGNLAARRPFNTGMESVGLGSVIDTVKVFGIALAFIAGAAGLVIVAAGGAFGGAGTQIRW